MMNIKVQQGVAEAKLYRSIEDNDFANGVSALDDGLQLSLKVENAADAVKKIAKYINLKEHQIKLVAPEVCEVDMSSPDWINSVEWKKVHTMFVLGGAKQGQTSLKLISEFGLPVFLVKVGRVEIMNSRQSLYFGVDVLSANQLKQLLQQPLATLELEFDAFRGIDLSDDQLLDFGPIVCETKLPEQKGNQQIITIGVQTLMGENLTFRIGSHDTIEDLKIKVMQGNGLPVDQQRLIYAGRQLEESRTLASYGIVEGATLHLYLRLRGGMLQKSSGRDNFAPINHLSFSVCVGELKGSVLLREIVSNSSTSEQLVAFLQDRVQQQQQPEPRRGSASDGSDTESESESE